MKTFLLVTAGVVAGLLLVIALGWLWLKRKLSGLGKALGALAAGLSGVPPFRITLEPVANPEWSDPARMLAASGSFEAVGYQAVGYFEVPELEGVRLRGFWHPRQRSYAVLYDHPQAGIFADVVALFTDRTLHTVSCSPETGMDRPERSTGERVEVDLDDPSAGQTLHDRLTRVSSTREVIATEPQHFPRVFVGAYKLEQDWRIARGGVTAAEVRAAAAAGGQEEPDDCAIELVQGIWKAAISEFVSEEAMQAYLAGNPMPAGEWEAKRERVRVVHDHCDAEDLVDELAWAMIAGSYDAEDDAAEDRAHGDAKQRLRAAFSGSVCAGFAAAQSLLPEKGRFEKIGSVTRPWAADFYLEPEAPAGGT